MVEAGGRICAATRLPVIGDGDTGYGNAVNAKRTVRGFAQAGFAGMLIEDQARRGDAPPVCLPVLQPTAAHLVAQVSPKACGHTRTRVVVPRGEAARTAHARHAAPV